MRKVKGSKKMGCAGEKEGFVVLFSKNNSSKLISVGLESKRNERELAKLRCT